MREVAVSPVGVPASLAPMVAGRQWARDTVGEAGASVHRLHAAGRPDLYLKHGAGELADAIVDEMTRTRWLARHLPVPGVEAFVLDGDGAWMLMSAVVGRTAHQLLEEEPGSRNAVVDALAAHLRAVHAIPSGDCSFDAGPALRLGQARARIDAGLVEEDEFDPAREGWPAERVWDAMTALLPLPFDRVVTHGDYSLDNILIEDGHVVGTIDHGRVGIADRYQDLAILWNCLGEFDPALQTRLFAAYGIDAPDQGRLGFHLMLDEMF